MSGLYDYTVATKLPDVPFDALIMAAVMKADTANLLALTRAFPDVVEETRARYDAPGGRLPSDGVRS